MDLDFFELSKKYSEFVITDMIKKKHSKFLFLTILFACVTSLQSQFILPEDKYTTHKDIDVIRADNDKIEIYGINAKATMTSPGEVKIHWNNFVKNAVLAVVRSEKPVSNLSALQLGKVVVVLKGGESNFKDTILNPGDYYYAVVSYQRLKDETVILKPNENYTTSPVHFDEKDLANQTESAKETVSNIKASILDDKTVRIQWNFDPVSNVSLMVYKNTHVIDSENAIKNSIRIGSVSSDKNYFDDQEGAGQFYYAVIVLQFGIEKTILKANENYTTKPVKKQESSNPTVKFIRAVKNKKNEIFISWYFPTSKFPSEFVIYRSSRQIVKEEDLQKAEIIQKLKPDAKSYIDNDYPDGDLYYAVLTQNKQGTIQKILIPDENTMVNPVINETESVVEEKKPEEAVEKKEEVAVKPVEPVKPVVPDTPKNELLIYDIQAVAERSAIRISWKPDKKTFVELPEKAIFFHLFRFREKPESLSALTAETYLAKIPLNEESYIDTPPESGLYYYAIFFSTPKGVLTDLKYGDNLIGPVIYKKPEEPEKTKSEKDKLEKEAKTTDKSDIDVSGLSTTQDVSAEKLNNALRRTYLQEKYEEAITALDGFRHSPSVKIKARAMFYSALSSYYLGKYKEAMEYIMNDSVKKVYGERADFWYRQILEKISK